jgi:hypothetical protein
MTDENEHDDTPPFDEGWLAETDRGVIDMRKVHTISAEVLAEARERDPELEIRPGTAELLRGRGLNRGWFFVAVPDEDGHLCVVGQFKFSELLA